MAVRAPGVERELVYTAVDQALTEFFRKVERREFYASVAAGLALDAPSQDPALAVDPASLATVGHTTIEGLIPRDRCAAMTELLRRLATQGVPPVFAYAYDAFWAPAAPLSEALARTLGTPELLDDVWAWFIPPTEGARGWTPHRGHDVLERRDDGRPLMLNVWIALTDTDADHACMHLVPKPDDPDYPDALPRTSAVSQGIAMPLAAGSALVWDANVLHWGGEMREGARHPRASFSYTLRAADAPALLPPTNIAPTLDGRLATIARQILRYEPQAHDVGGVARRWAELTHSMGFAAKNKP